MRIALGLVWLVAPACGGADNVSPRLLSATPASAGPGQSVLVAGTQLCGGGDCAAAGGDLELEYAQPVVLALTELTDTELTFVVPPAPVGGATTLVLTVDDTSSNALAFTVLEDAPGGSAR